MLNETTEVPVDPKVVNKLKNLILIHEVTNLSTKKMKDAQMVQWIKKQIEEEVKKCSSNQ
jgi:uncharacterized protein YehS (DUF1456 family)